MCWPDNSCSPASISLNLSPNIICLPVFLLVFDAGADCFAGLLACLFFCLQYFLREVSLWGVLTPLKKDRRTAVLHFFWFVSQSSLCAGCFDRIILPCFLLLFLNMCLSHLCLFSCLDWFCSPCLGVYVFFTSLSLVRPILMPRLLPVWSLRWRKIFVFVLLMPLLQFFP